jgi:hypothetical protein
MGHIKEPKGIDFVIKSEPLTSADRKMISEYILNYKQKIVKKTIVTKKAVKSKRSLQNS